MPRRAAQGRSQAPSSGPARRRSIWPAGFLPSALRTSRSCQSSHSAHLPGAPVLLLPVTSEELGIKLRLVFQPAAGQTAEIFAVHARRPRALRGRPEGVPVSARLPQSPRGPRMGGCLTFYYPPSSEPAGAGSVCVLGDRGLCAPRGPPPPSVPGWIASSCGFTRPGLGIITRSRRPESQGELGYPHNHPKGHPLYLPCLTFHGGRDPRARWRSATQCLLLRGARGLSRGLQLTGDQVPSRHEAPEFAFHVFHQYSQSII